MLMRRLFATLYFVLPMTVWAETDGEPGAKVPVQTLPNMIVTGSHLAQSGIDALPVTTIDVEAIESSGFRSLGEFLQALPMMSGAPISTAVGARSRSGAFSRGTESVELRGLGPERTLVLLNGRRMVAGGNGTNGLVDLATIPMGLIERIEILKNGASVEYGADAVAGVVNIITRKQMDGLHLHATLEQSERGDGQAFRLSSVNGFQWTGVDLVAGVEWFDQQPTSKADRAYSRQQLRVIEGDPDNRLVAAGISSAPPQGRFRVPDEGDRILTDGRPGTSIDDFRPFEDPADRYNFNPFEDLLQESRRLSAFFQASRSFNGLLWHSEAVVQQRDSRTNLAPLPLFTNRLDGVRVSAENVYNPFGVELDDVRRRLVEGGPRVFSQDNRLWRLATALEGAWQEAKWEIFLGHGRNRVSQNQNGDLLQDRLTLALGPSFEQDGTVFCGTPGATIEGCVPLNLFGGQRPDGSGSITSEMLNFVAGGALVDEFRNEQTIATLGWQQDMLILPAGSLRAAFGVEYRRESARDVPDSETQAGNTTGAARGVTQGSYEARDVYAEFKIPILRGQPGVQDMEIETGLRLVDYSNFDRHTVFDWGWFYEPHSDWAIRAAYAESFRAPTVGELFGGTVQSNPAVPDPCADFDSLNQQQTERCIAQGVPADGSFDQSGNETPQFGGGNSALQPEEARMVAASVRWRPEALRPLQVHLDYFDVRINGGIAALGAATTLEQCLATGAAIFCDRIERARDGTISAIQSQLQNLASESARGWDLDFRYKGENRLGSWQHRLLLSQVLERTLIAFPGGRSFVGASRFDADNFGAIPRWKARYTLDWSKDAWRATYALQWIDSLSEAGGELFAGSSRHIPSVIYHDLSAMWATENDLSISLAINNLLDQDPPIVVNADTANTDVSTYRLLGRSFLLRWSYRW